MQDSLGAYVRQLRRKLHLTQTELGGGHFSRSYVSAFERGALTPSSLALRFFAERLGQSVEDFETLLAKDIQTRSIVSSDEESRRSALLKTDKEIIALLDVILSRSDRSILPLLHSIMTSSEEEMDVFSPDRQARYIWLQGLLAQEAGSLTRARAVLEYALALAPAEHQPALLDALGTNYYLAQEYQTALNYHRRARQALQQMDARETAADLLLTVELHCGDDYRSLGAHHQACIHYEHARQVLSAHDNINRAGWLYLNLGYCTYASLYQEKPVDGDGTATSHREDEQERDFQRALSFLLQSRALYQAIHDYSGESKVRLIQAMVLLDFSIWQSMQRKSRFTGLPPSLSSGTLLDEAEEQCRQILMTWQKILLDEQPSEDVEIMLYKTLGYLIRVHTRRAFFARLSGYTDTAVRERALAAALSQLAFDSIDAASFSQKLLDDVLSLSGSKLQYYDPSLPRLPLIDPLADGNAFNGHFPHLQSRAEVYFAAGNVSEEFGRAATTADYTCECYQRADEYVQLALSLLRRVLPNKDYDVSYLMRYYQRYAHMLEERVEDISADDMLRDTMVTSLKILQESLFTLTTHVTQARQRDLPP